jgi:hypothetical protein
MMTSDEITVSGISFNHGADGEYEFYPYTDPTGTLWQAWQHLLGQQQAGWYATIRLSPLLLPGSDIFAGPPPAVRVRRGSWFVVNDQKPQLGRVSLSRARLRSRPVCL